MDPFNDSQSNNSKFHFPVSPFQASPQAAAYCDIGSLKEARLRIERAIQRSEGPAILIGPPGTGKTLLCELLSQRYEEAFQVVSLVEGSLDSTRELLQSILFKLDMPYRDQEEGEMRLSLIDHLRPAGRDDDNGVLLIIDEAQQLTVELLEEIRMISSIVRGGQPRVRLVMAGGPRLDESLADPQLTSFAQRIAARCYIHSWSAADTSQYVHDQFERVGADSKSVIEDAAVSRVHAASDGIPRLINQLMNHTLYYAESRGVDIIDAELVSHAWADLQQLPMPAPAKRVASAESIVDFGPLSGSTPASNDSVVEFGALDSEASTFEESHDSKCGSGCESACDAPCESELEAVIGEEELVSVPSGIESKDPIELLPETEGTIDAEIEYNDSQVVAAHTDREDLVTSEISGVIEAGDGAVSDAANILEVCHQPPVDPSLYDQATPELSLVEGTEVGAAEQTSSDSAESATEEIQETPLPRDFPVVKVTGNKPVWPADVPKDDWPTASEDAAAAEKSDVLAEIDCQDNEADGELSPESACFTEAVSRVVDGEAADLVGTDLSISTATDEAVSSEATFASIDNELWDAASLNASADANANAVPEDAGNVNNEQEETGGAAGSSSSDPFGDGFDEEIEIAVGQPVDLGSIDAPPAPAPEIVISDEDSIAGSIQPAASASGNDQPSIEIEESLRREVISINHEAIGTSSDEVTQYFSDHRGRSGSTTVTPQPAGSHGLIGIAADIEVSGDDRDILIVEDDVKDEKSPQAGLSSSADPTPTSDLATLFTRIRNG